MVSRVFILGGSGYVGGVFERHLQKLGVPCVSLGRRDVDYTRLDALRAYLRENRPAFLVNCAGFTGKPNVDACELQKAETLAGNAVLPGTIHAACADLGIPWGHVSSGCIFTGDKGGAAGDPAGFAEDDAPNFSFRQNHCSFYSGTKALGEEVLGYKEARGTAGTSRWEHEGTPDCYIWRLRIPFSSEHSPRNYLSKVMVYKRLLEARNSLSELNEFVAACYACFEKRLPYGIYNLTQPGSVTTRDVVELIRAESTRRRAKGLPDPFPQAFDFFESEDEFMKLAAKTPRSNCVLDSRKAVAAGIPLTPVRDAVARALASWNTTSPVR